MAAQTRRRGGLEEVVVAQTWRRGGLEGVMVAETRRCGGLEGGMVAHQTTIFLIIDPTELQSPLLGQS